MTPREKLVSKIVEAIDSMSYIRSFVGGNIIRCGYCGCEYDANNFNGCPQCGFGKKEITGYRLIIHR